MTERQILSIKYSWSYLVREPEEAIDLFYQKLFELNPALKPLFKNNMALQVHKFRAMLTMIVSRLQNVEEVADEIIALALRHVGYGAQLADYKTVGEALLWMLERGLGERWNQETREAWELMYRQLSERMIAATKTNTILP